MEDDDTKVTDPPESPVKETPPPVAEPEKAHDDLRPIVDRLSEEVAELRTTVASLIPGESDTTPTKPPWTHRKVF